MPDLPPIEGERSLAPWQSRWSIDAKRKVVVVATLPDGRVDVVDARAWVESLHDASVWPDGSTFGVVVEAAE